MQTIAALKEGDWVDETFLVAAKQIMIAKTGGMYLSVKLADKTGEVDGKLWDNAEEIAGRFEKEDFVRVKGVAANYQGMMQVKMKTVEKVDDSKVDLANFLETSPRNIDEMVKDLSAAAAGVKNKHLNQVMNAFLTDKAFMDDNFGDLMLYPYITLCPRCTYFMMRRFSNPRIFRSMTNPSKPLTTAPILMLSPRRSWKILRRRLSSSGRL